MIRQSQSPQPVLQKYRENVRWTAAGVTFVTLHVTGSNNGLGRAPDGDAEYEERNKANLAWLQQGFEYAKANDSRAIMILQQANIFPAHAPTAGSPEKDPNGFTDVRTVLEKETIAFAKPVVLVHGDSHFFRIDKPLPARGTGRPILPSIENFTRLETSAPPTIIGSRSASIRTTRTCSASGKGLSQPTSSSVSEGGVAGSTAN